MFQRRRGGGDDGQTLLADDDRRDSYNPRSDTGNIALLLFLYLLQGIPLGLTAAIPMILQNRGVSYKQQAEFSFVYWPFSLKLLWAPIVDSCYSPRFGRRKTWLIPAQLLIGSFMFFLSYNVEHWLGDDIEVKPDDSGKTDTFHPNVPLLTFVFFCLNFLSATQDIAVDGWALTMLKRSNVGHASTCNSVGQTAGYFLGFVVLMALESPHFCNTFLRSYPSPQGIVTLSSFLYFWSIVFFVTTIIVGIVKKETVRRSPLDGDLDSREEHHTLDTRQTYRLLWDIINLPAIKSTILVLLTCKIAFSACDAVTSLKLVDSGVPKEELAILIVPLVPLQLVLPLILSKHTTGSRPMDIYLKAIPYRLAFGVLASVIVWLTPTIVKDGAVPTFYYVFLLVSFAFHQVALYSMFVAVMAFFAQISDPAVGGTYMTLLNTLSNLGGNWPSTLALWMVDSLTWKTCILPNGSPSSDVDCSSSDEVLVCEKLLGRCSTVIDGYYIEIFFCTVFGILWLWWARPVINSLQTKDRSAWKVVHISGSR